MEKVQIRISGPSGSGKTYLANRIGALMLREGHHVTVLDEGGRVHINPVDPTGLPRESLTVAITAGEFLGYGDLK